MKPIVVFYHCCIPSDNSQIDSFNLKTVSEQLDALQKAGLYDAADKIFCNLYCGSIDIFKLFEKYPKIEIYYDTILAPSEGPTLKLVKEYCDKNDCNVLYFHSKGTFNQKRSTNCWRRYMEYFNIYKWEKMVESLSRVELAGVEMKTQPYVHFSGNFWWATSDYIKKCEMPDPKLYEKRLQWEFWLMRNMLTARVYNAHQSKINLYNHCYTEDKYVDAIPSK